MLKIGKGVSALNEYKLLFNFNSVKRVLTRNFNIKIFRLPNLFFLLRIFESKLLTLNLNNQHNN